MDDFKKAGVVVLTVNDLNVKCVCFKNKTRRRLMRIARKLARRKLKEEVTMQTEEYPDDLHGIFPWIKPGIYKRVEPENEEQVKPALRNQPAETGV